MEWKVVQILSVIYCICIALWFMLRLVSVKFCKHRVEGWHPVCSNQQHDRRSCYRLLISYFIRTCDPPTADLIYRTNTIKELFMDGCVSTTQKMWSVFKKLQKTWRENEKWNACMCWSHVTHHMLKTRNFLIDLCAVFPGVTRSNMLLIQRLKYLYVWPLMFRFIPEVVVTWIQ